MATKGKWRNDTAPTLKYKVVQSEKFGRYLQAAKNLTAGEMILREMPVVVGPATSRNDNICFACLRLLPKLKQKTQYVCSKCKVAPLCNIICQEQTKHHTADECETLKNNKNLTISTTEDIIGVLLPLRLWLLKQRDSDLWKRINYMEAHLEKSRNMSVWHDREINVINVMKSLQLVTEDDSSISELLHQLCGILGINCFALRCPGSEDSEILQGLYVEASLMAHDCRGNTHLTVDNNFQLTVYASLPIKEDEPIFCNYISSLLGKLDRKERLQEKCFECECSLCIDPYEMGSYMSSLLCPRCREGYIGMQNPLTNFPYEKGTRWQCNKCRSSIGGHLVRATLNISRVLIDAIDKWNTKALESLAVKLLRSFHPNHYLMLSLKQKLLDAYRKEMATPNSEKKLMQGRLDVCKDIYNVLEIIQPGISRLKGVMLYEMYVSLVSLANHAHTAQEISYVELASRLEEASDLLKKSFTMLLLEPADTPEGKFAKLVVQEWKALNRKIVFFRTIGFRISSG